MARPASTVYQIRKLIARHKLGFGSAAASVVLLAVVAALMTVQAQRIARERNRANSEAVVSMERVAAAVPPRQALQAMMQAYLSETHVKGIETGCATAALGSEMPRQAPEVRRAATRRIKEMIDLVARHSPDWGQTGAHEHALVAVSTMVGALVLARAVDDARLSDALREAALNHLTSAD